MMTAEDRRKIESGIREKYQKVVIGPEGDFQYPTGKAGLKGQSYNAEILNSLPDEF